MLAPASTRRSCSFVAAHACSPASSIRSLVTGIAQVAFPRQANGSLIVQRRQGRRLGADRPAVRRPEVLLGPALGDRRRLAYNARRVVAARTSGPPNPALVDAVKARVDALQRRRSRQPRRRSRSTSSTASGSGLDPHISPAAARYQVAPRRAGARARRRATVRRAGRASTPRAASSGSSASRASTSCALNLALDALRRCRETTRCAMTSGRTRARRPARRTRCARRRRARSAAGSRSSSAPRRASARPSPCSRRRASASARASTSWSASSRRTAAPRPRRCSTGLEILPAPARSTTAARRSRSSTSTPPRAQARSSSSSTSSRTPTRPGCRHPKRWQDVEELLDAGIDVYTTLNVQHLESLNDVVAQITGVRVRETVPDARPRPRRRGRAGRPAARGAARAPARGQGLRPRAGRARARATSSSSGNLIALRELALRETAERVDDADAGATRRAHAIAGHVGRSPSASWSASSGGAARRSASCARRGAWRSAAARRGSPCSSSRRASRDRPEAERERVAPGAAARRAARRRGGDDPGRDVAEELLRYARERNVTEIVLGKPLRSRWRELLAALAGRRGHPPAAARSTCA